MNTRSKTDKTVNANQNCASDSRSEQQRAIDKAMSHAYNSAKPGTWEQQQAQHSPLPRKASGNFTQAEADACNQAEIAYGMLQSALKYKAEIATELTATKAHAEALAEALRCALADLQGIMPEFEPSGDRTHPGWTTINAAREALANWEGVK